MRRQLKTSGGGWCKKQEDSRKARRTCDATRTPFFILLISVAGAEVIKLGISARVPMALPILGARARIARTTCIC